MTSETVENGTSGKTPNNLGRDGFILLIGLAICTASILIGTQSIDLLILTLILFPIIFAFLFGLVANLGLKFVDKTEQTSQLSAELVRILVILLIIKYGLLIGTQIEDLFGYGPALIFQELGNLGTVFFGMPFALLALRMRREAIGATFSIGREPNIAIIADRYGISSREGLGVLGVYIMGSLIGSVFFSVFPTLISQLGWFSLEALSMACGVGSASMTAACSSALTIQHPEQAESVNFLAGASNLFSNFLGFYVCILLAIPLSEFLYRKLSPLTKSKATSAAETTLPSDRTGADAEGVLPVRSFSWVSTLTLLLASTLLCVASEFLYGGRDVNQISVTATALFLVGGASLLLKIWFPRFDAIVGASILSIIFSLCLKPTGFSADLDGISILAIATPVLAFSGLALTRSDFVQVRSVGYKLAIVSIIVFSGTYVLSAVIANTIIGFTAQ